MQKTIQRKNIMLISESLINELKRINIKKLSHQFFDILIDIILHSIVELILTNEIHIMNILSIIIVNKLYNFMCKKLFKK